MNDTPSDAASLFAPLWKRKWLILGVAILVAVGTYEYYKHQPLKYKATTQLFLGSSEPGLGASSKTTLSARELDDQVGKINSSPIARAARVRLRSRGDIEAVHGTAIAAASPTSDFIVITTEDKTPLAAVQLANSVAQVYVARQKTAYLLSVKAQILTIREQIRRIESAPTKGSKGTGTSATLEEATLASKISQLESDLSTFTGVQQYGLAKAQPLPTTGSPKKNAIFGFVLGLVLAAAIAYVLDRMDARIRRLADVETIFQTQILAALPSVRAPVVRPDGRRLPAKSLVEPLRRLNTVLQLGEHSEPGEHEHRSHVLLFLSPDPGDGRSSLIANLARVQSDAGKRVVVVEADFRRPTQGYLLDLHGSYGLADVLGEKVGLDQAMQIAESPRDLDGGAGAAAMPAVGGVTTVVESSRVGSLSVLAGGGVVSNPPAILAGERMAGLIHSLAEEYDYVLIDAPPPLEVSDAIPLMGLADAIVIVASIGHTREVSATRLEQLLQRTPSARVLGAVVNNVPPRDIEKYGFSMSAAAPRRGRRPGR